MSKNIWITVVVAIAIFACKTHKDRVVDAGHNSRNSLDWEGIYRDTLPCADCEGILIEIVLKADNTFEMGTRYIGKGSEIYRSSGKLTWENNDNAVVLSEISPGNEIYKYTVGENILIKLDSEGKKITGTLGKNSLKKQQEIITDRYWKLVKLNGSTVKTADGEREAFLVLTSVGNRVYGHAGCNSVQGSIEFGEMNRIKFSKMAATLMACPNMETESEFLQALETADSYYLNGDTLELHRARMAPLARFENVFLK